MAFSNHTHIPFSIVPSKHVSAQINISSARQSFFYIKLQFAIAIIAIVAYLVMPKNVFESEKYTPTLEKYIIIV